MAKKLAPKERLEKIRKDHPYLEQPHHQLNPALAAVKDAVAGKADDADPEDLLNRLEVEIEAEDKTLDAAFRRFDHSGKHLLRKQDVGHMCKYLGFPNSDDDIDRLMEGIGKDKFDRVNRVNFRDYVRKVGGTQKLFEERRRRIDEKGGFTPGDPEQTKMAMKHAGIDEDAQAYWRLVVSPTEFTEAGKLVPCQQKALALIRKLAKKNHETALPKIQKRMQSMKDHQGRPLYKDEHLWMTLAWIRELAPVIIHVNMDKMVQFLESDTHYRNQFETNTSGGLLKPHVREKWEKDLFGGQYDKADGFNRPKYGVLNVMNDHRGVVKCKQYGESYLILKDARLRCTFSPEDSANLKSDKLAVLDFYAHVLLEYSDEELKETIKVANSTDAAILGDSDRVGAMKYKEAQIHGEVCFKSHVARLVVCEKHRGNQAMVGRIERLAEKHGWKWGWRDQERQRLKDEKVSGCTAKTWEERMSLLEQAAQEKGDGEVVIQEGMCKMGCGRCVQPGLTRAKRPFITCCKGCVMGFGHDLRCGQVDATKVGIGLCKHGCGRKVAPGRDAKGRPLDTCCRACAMGLGYHDETCGQEAQLLATRPMCSTEGCQRCVASGTQPSGKPWRHCCKGCALGRGHTADCEEQGDAPPLPPPASPDGEMWTKPTTSYCTPVRSAPTTSEPSADLSEPSDAAEAADVVMEAVATGPEEPAAPPPPPVVVTAVPAAAAAPSGGSCCVLS